MEHEEEEEGFIPLGGPQENDEADDDQSGSDGPTERSGVLYVGHLPHGMFEEQLGNYFGQFGKIERVQVSRSTRTAASRGYGWVRFTNPDACSIAAKAMDGYMLFQKKLVCRVVPPEEVPPKLFRNTYRKMLPSRRPALHKAAVNATKTDDRTQRVQQRLLAQKKRWEAAGIDYEFPMATEAAKQLESATKKHKAATEEVDVDASKPAPADNEVDSATKKPKQAAAANVESQAATKKPKQAAAANVESATKKPKQAAAANVESATKKPKQAAAVVESAPKAATKKPKQAAAAKVAPKPQKGASKKTTKK